MNRAVGIDSIHFHFHVIQKGSFKDLEVFKTSERKRTLAMVTQEICQATMLVHKLLQKETGHKTRVEVSLLIQWLRLSSRAGGPGFVLIGELGPACHS